METYSFIRKIKKAGGLIEMGLTKSKDIPAGKKIEISKEQIAIEKEKNEKILESYNVQLDVSKIQIEQAEKSLALDLPTREVKAQIEGLKEQVIKFEMYKKAITLKLKQYK